MKKALKILAWTLIGILALVLILVLTIPLWLGPTVKSVANKVAPEYTGTEFSIADVSLNPYTGKYRITELRLGNPKGYPVPVAFSVSNVLVDVEMSSLATDTIHIREITIDNPYASYVDKDGTNNFEWIQAHVEAKIGPKEEEEEEEEDKGPGKKVIIDKLTIAGTRVKLKFLPEMPIMTITRKDIGKEKGGATFEEVGKMLADAIMKATSSLGEGLTAALGALGDGANNLVGGATNLLGGAAGVLGGATTNLLGGATGALTGTTTNVLGGASKALDGATKSVGDAAKKLGELGGGLFGGSSDKPAVEKPAVDKPASDKPVAEKPADAKPAGNKVIEATKAAGNGAVEATKAVGSGAVEATKAVGEGLKKLNPFGK